MSTDRESHHYDVTPLNSDHSQWLCDACREPCEKDWLCMCCYDALGIVERCEQEKDRTGTVALIRSIIGQAILMLWLVGLIAMSSWG